MYNFKFFITCFSFALLVFGGEAAAQSSRKSSSKKKSNSELSNRYQDLVSRNNYYFNADQILKESILRLRQTYKDNYNEILRISPFEGGEPAAAISGDMDNVIAKANKDIKKHPKSKWVDNQYVNIGKAYYFKGDKAKAADAFRYVNKYFGLNVRKGAGSASKSSATSKTKTSSSSKNKSKSATSSSKKSNSDKMTDEERAKAREKDQLKKEKEKAKKERDKQIKKRNSNKAKLKKINASRKKKGQKPLTYKEKFGEDPYGTNVGDAEDNSVAEDAEAAKKAEALEKAENAKKAAEEKKQAEQEEAEALEAKKQAETLLFSNTVNVKTGGGLFSHKPSLFEAHLWLARTNQDADNQVESFSILNAIAQNKKFPRKKQAELYGLYTQYYINTKDYTKAMDYVDKTIEYTKKKKNKHRLYFIKGQLHEKFGNNEEALKAFTKSKKNKVNYVMNLNAQMRIIQLKLNSGKLSNDQAVAELGKLRDDPKNAEFKDHILGVMSNLALESGDVDGAIAMLTDAAKNSNTNKDQKAGSYLKLAELLYNQNEFIKASAFYDSTMAYLNKTHADYEKIKERQILLAELMPHLQVIQVEDSLLHIASLDEKQRNEWAQKVIEDYEKKLAAAKAAEEAAQLAQSAAFNSSQGNTNTGSRWYFYNESQKAQGYQEFVRKMGPRNSSDFWIIQSKSSNMEGGDSGLANGENSGDTDKQNNSNRLSKQQLLSSLPLKPEQKKIAHGKLEQALFAAGNIYYTKLNNNPLAITSLDRVVTEYAQSDNVEQAYYMLYLASKEENNIAQANLYKDELFTKFPDGLFTNMLKDPDFAAKQKMKSKEADSYYEQTYALYNAAKYQEVLNRKKEAEVKFASNNSISPKMDLLEALTIGHLQDKQAYIEALKNVRTKHVGHEVRAKAEELLKYLGESVTANTGTQESSTANEPNTAELYKKKDEVTHYNIVYIGQSSDLQAKVMANLTAYNTEKYASLKLKTKPLLVGDQHIIYIQNFPNAKEAKKYYDDLLVNIDRIFAPDGKGNSELFFMSKPNFTTFFGDKRLEPYLEFFKQNY